MSIIDKIDQYLKGATKDTIVFDQEEKDLIDKLHSLEDELKEKGVTVWKKAQMDGRKLERMMSNILNFKEKVKGMFSDAEFKVMKKVHQKIWDKLNKR